MLYLNNLYLKIPLYKMCKVELHVNFTLSPLRSLPTGQFGQRDQMAVLVSTKPLPNQID